MLLQSKSGYFSTNEILIRYGFKKSRLGSKKQALIIEALNHHHTDKVFVENGKIYKLLLNGTMELL